MHHQSYRKDVVISQRHGLFVHHKVFNQMHVSSMSTQYVLCFHSMHDSSMSTQDTQKSTLTFLHFGYRISEITVLSVFRCTLFSS